MILRLSPVLCLLACISSVSAETVSFTLDPIRSSITLTDNAFLDPETVVPLPAQEGTGNIVGYMGSIVGDLVGETLTFSGDSAVVALEHPKVLDFVPFEGGPGGPDDPDAQDINYAYALPGYPISETETTTLYVQLFDMVLNMPFGSVTNGQAATDFDLQLDEGGYAIILDNPDIVNDTAWFNKPFNVIEIDDPVTSNTSSSLVSIVTEGNLQTLTIPISADFVFEVDVCCGNTSPTEFILEGQLVATRTLGGGVAADLNNDGAVDAADAAVMFGNWGNAGLGDLNNDSIVDAADAGEMFAVWTGDATPTSAVPEPTSLGLLLVAGVALLRAKR